LTLGTKIAIIISDMEWGGISLQKRSFLPDGRKLQKRLDHSSAKTKAVPRNRFMLRRKVDRQKPS